MPAIGTRREEVAAQPQLTMHSWVESPPRMEGRGREGALAGGIFAEMVGVRPLCGSPSISVATEQPSARCVAHQPVGGGDAKRLWVFFPISKSFIQAFLSSSFRDQFRTYLPTRHSRPVGAARVRRKRSGVKRGEVKRLHITRGESE